jgi:hypothetical protein
MISRDFFHDLNAFANKFGDSLVNALVGVLAGAVTAAVTGNIVEGVKVAATGIGKLIVDVMRTPAETRSLTGRTGSFFKRLFTSFMLADFLIGLTIVLVLVSVVAWGLKKNPKPPFSVVEEKPEPSNETATSATQTARISVSNENDEEFQERGAQSIKNRAVILAINRWKNGTTLAGCDRDGANMTRRVLETWGAAEQTIANVLNQYWSNEAGFYKRVIVGDSELRVMRNSRATCDRAGKALDWATKNMREESDTFWYNTMHGTQTPSESEPDGLDESAVMYDFVAGKPPTYFLDNRVAKATEFLPFYSSFLAMLDICHAQGFLRSAGLGIPIPRFLPFPEELQHLLQGRKPKARAASEYDNYTNDMTLLLAGCESESVSYSNWYEIGGERVMEGALTHNFLKVHAEKPTASLQELHDKLYPVLANGKYVQRPQLQGSQRLKNKPFLIGA